MKKLMIFIANRLWLILVIYALSLLAGAMVFALVEQKSFADGIWWATVTSLTIGYGDLSPATLEGRVMAVIFAHFWIFCIIPMIVASIITHILVDKGAFTHEEQEWQERSLQKIAAKLDVTLDPPPRDY